MNKEIKTTEIWGKEKKADLKKFITVNSAKQSKERVLTNNLLAIQYKLEDYVQNDNDEAVIRILDFIKMYLKELQVTKKELAQYFGMKDSNLHKYLSGERKLNAKVVLKISAFSHTKPEHWYSVQVKNELRQLKKENLDHYKKYDYRNLIQMEE
jgi:plasmid maintenance system antidote protein VapI